MSEQLDVLQEYQAQLLAELAELARARRADGPSGEGNLRMYLLGLELDRVDRGMMLLQGATDADAGAATD